MIKDLVSRWPVVRQILDGGDGTGPEAMSHRTETLRPKNDGAQIARSVCRYCEILNNIENLAF
jgi:hypothetical protein